MTLASCPVVHGVKKYKYAPTSMIHDVFFFSCIYCIEVVRDFNASRKAFLTGHLSVFIKSN